MQVTTPLGSTVAVHDLGGAGSPLLICHATGFLGWAYEPMARLLHEHHHVFAVDAPGHGDSPPPADGDFDWRKAGQAVAAAAEAVKEATGAERLHGFGHSMGGALVLFVEATHPGTFRDAYVFEPILPPPGALSGEGNPLATGARKRRATFPSKEAALWRYASRPPLDAFSAGALAAYVEHGFRDEPDGTVSLKCAPESEARTFESAGIAPEEVAAADIPVVVAAGYEVDAGPAAFAPHVVEALPRAILRRYEHIGHFGPFQDPATIAADVLALTTGA